jgi:tRNA-splicing ligase RtcB
MLCVHRKGATRAFAPQNPVLPDKYKNTGQPVLIPGDMGRASYVLCGTAQAMEETFGSTCHGAGRVMSRGQAIKASKGRFLEKELETKGIYVKAASKGTLAEEMPEAYKDVSKVVHVVHGAGISKLVAKNYTLGVHKRIKDREIWAIKRDLQLSTPEMEKEKQRQPSGRPFGQRSMA